MKDLYEAMQECFNEAKEYHNENSYYNRDKFPNVVFKDFDDFAYGKDYDIIDSKFPIPAKPSIFFYEQSDIENKDLSAGLEDVEYSVFFPSLFRHLDEDITKIAKEYEKSKSKNTPFYKKFEKELNKKIKEKINRKFNELYYQDSKKESYHFEIHLEENKIVFSMYKNNEAIALDEQSTGFQKFFSFFFDFLYNEGLQRGDIILIDEADTHLSIPAQKDFRKFLKAFGQKSGLTFIISTHSHYMIDIHHLDEVRIVAENPNENGKGVVIYNDFSLSAKFQKSNALYEIQKALGTQILQNEKLIFVEGLTDYHYLNAFKSLYEKEKQEKCNLVFLPVGGIMCKGDKETLEQNQETELIFTESQKTLAQNLIDLATAWRIKPILLVDYDKAGRAMKKGVENDKVFEHSGLCIITLKEAFDNSKDKENIEIEDLFSEEDRQTFCIESHKGTDIESKSSVVAKIFKNTQNLDSKISDETKINFVDILLTYLKTL